MRVANISTGYTKLEYIQAKWKNDFHAVKQHSSSGINDSKEREQSELNRSLINTWNFLIILTTTDDSEKQKN